MPAELQSLFKMWSTSKTRRNQWWRSGIRKWDHIVIYLHV